MQGRQDLTMSFEDDEVDVRKSSRNKKNRKDVSSSKQLTAGSTKIPKIQDLESMVNSKVLSILPRVEARQTALRNALHECLDQISEHGHLLQKFQDLVKKGVTEEQVDTCIREGSDPYGLERQKSLFKCMYQLGRRLQLVSLMLGKRDVLGTNMMPLDIAPKAEDVTTALRKMVKFLGRFTGPKMPCEDQQI